MIHNMRLFHFYYEEAHNALGAEPSEFVKLLDACELHAWTEKDAAMMAIMLEVACEFYQITEEGWEEWR